MHVIAGFANWETVKLRRVRVAGSGGCANRHLSKFILQTYGELSFSLDFFLNTYTSFVACEDSFLPTVCCLSVSSALN